MRVRKKKKQTQKKSTFEAQEKALWKQKARARDCEEGQLTVGGYFCPLDSW